MTVTGTPTDAWLRRFAVPATDAADGQVVCFPHAGGSAAYYHPMARALAPAVELLAVQYPGRQDRRHEPCLDRITDLAGAVAGHLAERLREPAVLFGHSMGALVSFEVARALEERGVRLRALVVSGRRAPSRTRDENVHRLDDDGIVAELARLSGTGSAVLSDPEIMRAALPAIRADYRAVETYRPDGMPRVGCPLLVLTGTEDPQVTVDEARDWERHTTGPCEVRPFPGGHFFLERHASAIIDLVRSRLRAAPGTDR